MSEMKRVQLTTVQPQKEDKKPRKKSKTFRFVLSLGESNAQTCPEYSFTELIKNEKKEASENPFNDDVDHGEVEALAQRFEAKYGPKSSYSGKKKRTREMDDYYDLGDGYDIDDPFIDNTEAYDEVIPSTLTTKHGGFYINQGQLDFKSLSDESPTAFTSPSTTPVNKKKKKKGALDSDSEEETGEALAKKFKAIKRKRLLEIKGGEKKKKKFSDGPDGDKAIKKKKKKNPQKLMLKKLAKQRELPKEPAVPSSPGTVSTPNTTITSAPGSTTITSTVASNSSIETKAALPAAVSCVITTICTTAVTSTTTLSSTLETAMNGLASSKVESGPNSTLSTNEERLGPVNPEAEESSSKSGDEARSEQQSGDKNTQLPAQLPSDLLNSIESIKKSAKESKEGKCKFFSPEINKLLLDIELGCHGLAWGSRSAIFGHLGEHLPCGKPALQRRAKKLRETQEEDELHTPIQRLKKAIMAKMPALLEQYEQKVLEAKSEAEKQNAPEGSKEETFTESEEDETKVDSTTSKKPKRPARKFQWTVEIKQFLKDIVKIKMKTFKTSKSRNQTAEEYIKSFLETVIKPLWPSGWMQTGILWKESRMCHEDLARTVNLQKNKQDRANLAGKPWPAVCADGNSTSLTLDTTRPQTHVSKTENVIEISSQVNAEKDHSSSSKNRQQSGAADGGGTVVVHLPDSSSIITSSGNNPPLPPTSSIAKLPMPPVEVIDITDSPARPSSSLSLSLPRSTSDKLPTMQKQGQPAQSLKTTPTQPLYGQHRSPLQQQQHSPHMQQQKQQQLQQHVSPVAGLPSPHLSASQSKQLAAKALDLPTSRYSNNMDPVYKAKVVLKPVPLGRDQQHKSGAVKNKPLDHTINSVAQIGGASKLGSLSQAPVKMPVSSSQGNSRLAPVTHTGGLLNTNKLSPQLSLLSSGIPISQTGPACKKQASPQQVRPGPIINAQSPRSSPCFPYTQSSPQHKASGSAPQRSMLGTNMAGTSRPDQPAVDITMPSRYPHTKVVRNTTTTSSLKLAGDSGSYKTSHVTHFGSTSPTHSAKKHTLHISPPSSNSKPPQPQSSPGESNSKMTLFERMQSQMLSQEAMEGQALKNLALARNLNLPGFPGHTGGLSNK